jgi:hypothetical protein
MDNEKLLRVQFITTTALHNIVDEDHKFVPMLLLDMTVSALFPQSCQEYAQKVPLVFQLSQLSLLRDLLVQLDLPPAVKKPPESIH